MKSTRQRAIEAAERLRERLAEADRGGYPNAWYFYVDRRDVEAVLAETVLQPKA